MLRRARLGARAIVLVFSAVMALGLMLGGAAAFAAPGAPTAEIQAGGDGYVNGSEVGAVFVNGTYDTGAVPPITNVSVRIVGAADCDAAAPYQTAQVQAALTAGTYTAGPFDLSGFPEGTALCARVRGSDDGGATYGALGLSTNRPVKDTVVLPGTLVMDDPNDDGFMNRAEAITSCQTGGTGCIPAVWTADAATDVNGARVWFEDENGVMPASGCGPWPPEPGAFGAKSAVGYVNNVCSVNLPEGKTFTFNGVWRDLAGNVSTEAASNALLKDTVAPAAPSVGIASDPIKADNVSEVEITGSSEHETAVGVTLTDGTNTVSRSGLVLNEDDEYTALLDASSLIECTYPTSNECVTARAFATDLAGNVSTQQSDSVFKDALVPAAPGIAVSPGTISDPSRQHAEITLTGEQFGKVNVSINDTDLGTPAITVPEFTLAGTQATLIQDVSALTEGTITISATVTDRVGNISSLGTAEVLKQLTATSVVVTSPTPGLLENEEVTFRGTAAPGAEVTVYEDRAGSQVVLGTDTSDALGNWSLDYYYTDKTSGAHTIFARTANGLGSAKVTFNVDTVRPTVSVTSLNNEVILPGQPVVFEGVATDDFAGVKEIDVFLWNHLGQPVDHRTATCTGCGTNSATWTIEGPAGLPTGVYLLQAWAVDHVGHRTAQPAEIRVVKVGSD